MQIVRVPHALTLIVILTGLTAVATCVIPPGVFEHVAIEGHDTVVPGTYHSVPAVPQGFAAVAEAPFKGLVEAADVVVFVLLVGGAFGVIEKTGAIAVLLDAATRRFFGKGTIFIPLSMLMFSVGGTLFGMCEETMPFYLLYVPLLSGLGYDALTGMAVVFLGAGIGVAASTLNPFATGIAQALSGLPPGSGLRWRVVAWLVMTAIASLYVTGYAVSIRSGSVVPVTVASERRTRTWRHSAVMIAFFTGMAVMVFGITRQGWSVPEIATLFVVVALLSGFWGDLSEHEAAEAFVLGAAGLVPTALVIGFARGILVVARDGRVIDTILQTAADFLSGMPDHFLLTGMLAAQSLIAFFVPSSSAHAALTMPVMAQLADLTRIPRQQVVTAFQFANGFSNLVTPTSGLLMGALAVAKVPWSRWVRFILPLLAILFATGALFVIFGAAAG
jgi:uncharacterized ion transporter superfamily protein YfcC